MKKVIDKLDFIKTKSICSVKDFVRRMRWQATDGEEIFAKDTSGKGLLSKVYKDFLKINNKKMNNPIK